MFDGEVMHSMDYFNLANPTAAALIKGKRIIVFGSGKSAFDIASECADVNGERFRISTTDIISLTLFLVSRR